MSLEERLITPIGEVISKSIMSLDSLKDASLLFMSSIDEEVKKARKDFRQEADPFKKEVILEDVEEGEKTKIVFNIPASHRRKITDRHKRFQRLLHAKGIIPRNFLIAYVSEFDYFLGALLKSIYKLRPELLNSSEKVFDFKDLCRFESLEDIREEVIEKDIEKILRASHSEQFKAIASKLEIDTLTKFPNWSKFIEITERRNLFVHADGIISTQYQKVCAGVGIKIDDNQIGEKLECSIDYLNDTYNIMHEVIIKLGQTVWRKVFGKELEHKQSADNYLISVLFELLCNEQYALAINIGEFAIGQKNISNDFRKKMMIINLCLAYKYLNKKEKYENILNQYDWSSVQDLFQLAISCINDEHIKSCELIKKLISNDSDELTEATLHSWPLFNVLKEQTIFNEMYFELFKTNFNNVSIIDKPALQEEISNADLEVSKTTVKPVEGLVDGSVKSNFSKFI